MTKRFGEELEIGDIKKWSLEKMREIANNIGRYRTEGISTNVITVKEVVGKTEQKGRKQIPWIIVIYFDHITHKDWTKSASLFSEEGQMIANSVEVGKTFMFTSKRQMNGHWAWTKLEEVEGEQK
jgi:hypothetical protein